MKDDKLLSENLGFTKCGDINTGGRPFIDTSSKAYYIDLPYGYISLKDTANHKLYDGNCLGAEATLWTEYVPDMKKADKMTYPRLGAAKLFGAEKIHMSSFIISLIIITHILIKTESDIQSCILQIRTGLLVFYRGFGLKNDSLHGKD